MHAPVVEMWFIASRQRLMSIKNVRRDLLSWRVSILKDNSMFQTKCNMCIKRQSQSQLIVRSAVITSVTTVFLLCREMRGELFLSDMANFGMVGDIIPTNNPSSQSRYACAGQSSVLLTKLGVCDSQKKKPWRSVRVLSDNSS